MQTVATPTRRSAFRPEFLHAPIQTEAAASCGVITIDRTTRTQETLALIEVEFATHSDFYRHMLRRAGVAPHELDDALGELFELAVRWAASYDPSKSGISSWLGNQVARTVASSVYGARRPAWRLQFESESSSDAERDNTLTDALLAAADEGQSTHECAAVAAFLERLAEDLTETEATAIGICGIDLLHERATEVVLAQMRTLIGARSNTTVRRIIHDLGIKVRALAVEHFGADTLVSRSGYEKLAA